MARDQALRRAGPAGVRGAHPSPPAFGRETRGDFGPLQCLKVRILAPVWP